MTGTSGGGPHPLEPSAGIAAAVRMALSRPARLGTTRLVSVDGPSGSGKTSLAGPLAAALATELGGRVITPRRRVGAEGPRASSPPPCPCPVRPGTSRAALDAGTSLAPSGRGESLARAEPAVTVVSTDLLATWEHPLDWWPLLEHHLLALLAAGRPADLPVVQWVSGNPRPGGSVHVPPVDVLVLEGVSSGRRAVADRLSLLVWVEVPGRAERLERAVGRDGEAMRPFLVRWQDDEDAHFAAERTRDRADVVIEPAG